MLRKGLFELNGYYSLWLILSIIALAGCNSDDGDEPTPSTIPADNGGTISAIEIDTNGTSSPWKADLVRVSRSNGMIQLQTNNYATGQSLLIEKEGEEEGSFFRDFGEAVSPTALFNIDRDIPEEQHFSQGVLKNTSTEFSVYFDTIARTASGSFDISFDDDNVLPVWRLTEGEFFDVPYDFGLLNVNGEISAELDGVPFQFGNNLGFVDHTFNVLQLTFTDLTAVQQIDIKLPLNIEAGTYASSENNLDDISISFTDFTELNSPEAISANIVLTITYHNPVTNAIAGTFSFDRPATEDYAIRQVRNGYFEFIYNDWD